jgi:hypothetical protein
MSLSHAPCPISELRMFDTVGAHRKARTKGSTASVQSIWKTPKMCCSCTHMSVWKGRPPVFQASPVATAHGPLLCVLLLAVPVAIPLRKPQACTPLSILRKNNGNVRSYTL